jgi:hypothetical protein
MSCAAIMGALAVIANFFRNLFPLWAVPCTGTGQSMSDFMQQDLVHLIIFILGGKIF